MNNLHIYVCENFANDYKNAILKNKCPDIEIRSFPCICGDKKKKNIARDLIENDFNEKILICGSTCPLLTVLNKSNSPNSDDLMIKTNNYCFHHFINDELIDYILEKGGYIITGGWLKSWKSRLESEGFNRENAQRFYGEFCKEIVLLNTGTEPDLESDLIELSEYLNIPYRIINTKLSGLTFFLEHLINEWRINGRSGHLKVIAELKQQRAEYATVLSIIEQVTGCTKKRDIISKAEDLIRVVFGANNIHYMESVELFETMSTKFTRPDMEIVIDDQNQEMLIKLGRGETCFGIFHVSEFMFPKTINRYVSFATSLIHVCSLAIANALQYEIIEKAKNDMTYIGFHDALTGLYNRNYFNHYIEKNAMSSDTALFACDVDGLKYVNDHLGHAMGDELISAAAQVLRKSFRETDIVARVGGDEFCIIMQNCSLADSESAKTRVQEVISEHNVTIKEKPYKLSLSVGLYHLAEGVVSNPTWESTLIEADNRMYAEKAEKKKRDDSWYQRLK